MTEIIDLSKEFPDAIKAERKDRNTLILRKISSIKRFDGKRACLELEHRWHRKEADVHSVLGQDYTYWQKKELNLNQTLFNQVNLF